MMPPEFPLWQTVDEPRNYPWLTETSSQPFTETPMPTNIKPRIVYCENCKYRITTDLPAPKCGICERFLIKILKTDGFITIKTEN